MLVNYICALITVDDVKKSKEFYENVLNQEIDMDHGENVSFKGGFAIHDREHFKMIIKKEIHANKQNNLMELYFESDDLDNIQSKLESLNSVFLHKIRELPWGQRVMRFYDLDNYIVEIGEPMDFVIRRFASQGLSPKEISEKSSMPLEVVKIVLK